jgi:hypothetical protein
MYGDFPVKNTKMPYVNRIYLGLARTIYIRCIYGNFGRENTKYTVIYGVYIRFWPTLYIPINVWFWPTLCACGEAQRVEGGVSGCRLVS